MGRKANRGGGYWDGGEGGGKYEVRGGEVQRFNPGLKLRVKNSIKVLK